MVEGIYLDHAATTPMRDEVWEAMRPYLQERFGNPSSVHRWGREARSAIEKSRERVAAAIGARRNEIVFTGGGTEADNLALLGAWRARSGDAQSVVCSAIEHKAVLAAAKHAGHEGAQVILLGVDGDGRIDITALDEALKAKPAIVSVMWVNNEVGTVQNVREIAERCRSANVLFHTDAVQAVGKVRVNVSEVPCDLLSMSAHKLAGPKGLGALFIRHGVKLEAIEYGGGQERALRPGTENVAAIVGLATAAELGVREQEEEAHRLSQLRDRLLGRLRATIPDLVVHGGGAPHIINLGLPGCDQDAILMSLDMEGVAVSSGSACQSGTVEPSHVLVAMGCADPSVASVRISLGRTTTQADIDAACAKFPPVVERVRSFATSV